MFAMPSILCDFPLVSMEMEVRAADPKSVKNEAGPPQHCQKR
jgi:hypothetical protein